MHINRHIYIFRTIFIANIVNMPNPRIFKDKFLNNGLTDEMVESAVSA